MSYAVAQGTQAQEAGAESQEKEGGLKRYCRTQME